MTNNPLKNRSTTYLTNKVSTFRIGSVVFKAPKELWKQCKEYGVKDKEIISNYNRFNALGVPSTKALAAFRALEEKKMKRFMR